MWLTYPVGSFVQLHETSSVEIVEVECITEIACCCHIVLILKGKLCKLHFIRRGTEIIVESKRTYLIW